MTTTTIPALFSVPMTEKSTPVGSRLLIRSKVHGHEHHIVVTGFKDTCLGLPGVEFSMFKNPGKRELSDNSSEDQTIYKSAELTGPYERPLNKWEVIGILDQFGTVRYDHAAICTMASVQEDYIQRQL